jgi:hypothetical protein
MLPVICDGGCRVEQGAIIAKPPILPFIRLNERTYFEIVTDTLRCA